MTDASTSPAGLALLRALRAYGVEYVFGNFGTDHPPLLESVAGRDASTDVPAFVICPHETTALSAAHGYAAATGRPQAVIVHVDVGTQNMGAMVHDAHRGNAPVFIIAGEAPHTNAGDPASRDSWVHYLQDVVDQAGIVRQFCRWTDEYRPPADPDEYVARGLERATTPPAGPAYLTATRESLAAEVPTSPGSRTARGVGPGPASADAVASLAEDVSEADAPLVITSKLGAGDAASSVESLVAFAEAAGAGVLETGPSALCFPRSHELHVGFDQQPAIDRADLVVLADVDVPWVPANVDVPSDLPIVQIDPDPTKGTYPRWDFPIDRRLAAAPAGTLGAVAEELPDAGAAPSVWTDLHDENRRDWEETVADHRSADRLTPATLAAAVDDATDEETVIVNESTTSNTAVLRGVERNRPGRYHFSHGSGLGWAPGAAIGVKLARPDDRVVTLVGDGSYVFANPTASAWVQGAYDAPTLTVVFNNAGWNAVRAATMRVHPDGHAASEGVPGSDFDPRMELAHAIDVVDAHAETVTALDALPEALSAGVEAVDAGRPAIVDVHLEPIDG